ncbi:G protein-regulated inducer of neurite outgrowth 3 [Echeneis naucrates]|uniref:G protein-regulated inducer of neurite outgrowth 3 n=1 Tax=Echeneis naucrates TaxID=173247 RepID=UPI0011135776|nr:G protein-regulated inducer of neurite outgrowth 3-like [Echeneis naucrates]
MGTNPKRTVTVQMVPQLAVADTVSNKESNTSWTKEPNVKLAQVCPNATLTSPDHKQDNLSLTDATPNVITHSQITASKGIPSNGNQSKSEHVTGGHQQMPELSVTGQGVVSKVSVPTSDYRTIGPSEEEEARMKLTSSAKATAAEDTNKHGSPSTKNLNNTCELRQIASAPQQENKGITSAPKNKDTATAKKSKESDHIKSLSQSDISPQEIPKPKKITDTTTPLDSTTPPFKSKEEESAYINENPSSTTPEKDLELAKTPQVSLNKFQPVSSQKDSSTQPLPKQNMPACGQVAEEASQSDTAVIEGQQQQHCKLYKEASTMTSSQSSTPVKHCRNMEVQAVANMSTKAVATSPSLLAFSVTRKPSGGAVPREEASNLAVVCQVDGGVGLQKINLISLSTCTDPRSETLTVEAEMCHNQNTGMVFNSLSQLQDAKLGAKPKEPGPALCNIQPVYQINIEHSNYKEQREKGSCQDKTASQTSAAKTTTAEAPAFKAGTPPETGGASKAGLADSNNAAPCQVTVTTKPEKAPLITIAAANTTSKSDRTKNKEESSKEKSTETRDKALKKEAHSGAETIVPEGKEKGDDQSRKQKGQSIHDVVWDEQGMTWEVYGASVDPESLGFAIQSHLQCKIKEQERKLMAQTSFRKSISGVDSPRHGRKSKRRQNIFRSMLQNVRRPNCCVRPPPSSVLE